MCVYLLVFVRSGVCRAEDIKHEGVMRALLGDDGTPLAARAAAALERLDQFLKVLRRDGPDRVGCNRLGFQNRLGYQTIDSDTSVDSDSRKDSDFTRLTWYQLG